ncbi:MAG: hypothetical protein RPR98_06850, partial [Bermanella sp.]
ILAYLCPVKLVELMSYTPLALMARVATADNTRYADTRLSDTNKKLMMTARLGRSAAQDLNFGR